MLESSVSSQMAAFVTRLSFDDLSADHIQKIKHYFLDWIGSAYGGKRLSKDEYNEAIQNYYRKRQWDASGKPTNEKLKALGLS